MAEVHIHVTDKNDNAPIFSQDVFYYDFEDTMAKELLNVTATDPDLGKGGIVKFRLLSWERVSSLCIAVLALFLSMIQATVAKIVFVKFWLLKEPIFIFYPRPKFEPLLLLL